MTRLLRTVVFMFFIFSIPDAKAVPYFQLTDYKCINKCKLPGYVRYWTLTVSQANNPPYRGGFCVTRWAIHMITTTACAFAYTFRTIYRDNKVKQQPPSKINIRPTRDGQSQLPAKPVVILRISLEDLPAVSAKYWLLLADINVVWNKNKVRFRKPRKRQLYDCWFFRQMTIVSLRVQASLKRKSMTGSA